MYIDNFVLRVVFCIVICIAATNLGMFTRDVIINHGPFVFDALKGLLFPTGLGVITGIMWTKPQPK